MTGDGAERRHVVDGARLGRNAPQAEVPKIEEVAMKHYLLVAWLALGMVVAAQDPSDHRAFEYVRRTMVLSHSYQAPKGYVPDADTAVAIAYAVTVPIYGRSEVDGEKPLRAELKDGQWLVLGTFHGRGAGGTLDVLIDQMTGKILYLSHSM
jgi:hypothetical protein